MKIAIFGDSFGDDYSLWPTPYTGVGPSWVDYLRNQNIEIDNYAAGGSSLFSAYQKFIANYQLYDKIIFIVTHPSRITVPMGNGTIDWFNFSQAEYELKHCADHEKRTILKAICDYYIYVKNDAYDNLVHKLIIKDISEKHDSVLMLPCFENSGIDDKMPLIRISEVESAFWKLDEPLPSGDNVYDARKCHMCEENNLILGKEIYNWTMNGNYNLTPENFKKPTREFTHYFRSHWNLLSDNR
jgi:hypothetical protein